VRKRVCKTECCLSWLVLSVATLGGCLNPSAIIISYDIDLQVKGVGPSGAVWSAMPNEISKPAPSPRALDPVGLPKYSGPLFEVEFAATQGGFTVHLANNSAIEICFRFDEAHLASNFQASGAPLRIFPPTAWRELPRLTKEDLDKIRASGPQKMDKACLAPGEMRRIPCYLDMKTFFPSGIMFNVSHPPHVAKLDPTGIGNWMRLHLPMETAGRREEIEFTMTARKSFARKTYY
jgi:hypothetical protein